MGDDGVGDGNGDGPRIARGILKSGDEVVNILSCVSNFNASTRPALSSTVIFPSNVLGEFILSQDRKSVV